jgi:hypothetical protein
MFKKKIKPQLFVWLKNAISHYEKCFSGALGLLLLITLCGCLSMKPLPKADLSGPDWTIRQGQAVWKPPGPKSPEIAGELILATRPDGSMFAQFTKTPFPFFIAQATTNGWQIEIPPQNKRYAAHGKPPARIVWFQLANALTGKPIAKGWTWHNSDSNWDLKNASGESLEGFFAQ